MANNFALNNANKFYCEVCHFECSKKSNYEIHLLTQKHFKAYTILTQLHNKMPENAEIKYSCQCGKNYKHRQSLHKHKKICHRPYDNNIKTNTYFKVPEFEENDDKALIIKLLQQNQELQKSLIELSKDKSVNNITPTKKKMRQKEVIIDKE